MNKLIALITIAIISIAIATPAHAKWVKTKELLGQMTTLIPNAYAQGGPTTEEIRITTYYPAPYGSYKTLYVDSIVFRPLTTAPANPVEGMTYYDDTANELRTWLP